MRKKDWPLLAIFAVLAVVLRIWQERTGFEESGLAIRGNLPGILLPAVLAAAAVFFAVTSRRLSAKGGESAAPADCFPFSDRAALFCVVTGSFLVLAAAASFAMGAAGSLPKLLAVFAAASAVAVLYTVFALRRGGDVQGVALLVPVCALVVYLIFLYRTDASDPVLARIYIEILAVAALTFSWTERSSFAFGNGVPRVSVPAAAIAVILALCAAAERHSLASVLLFTGCAAVELGFLAAADFEER